jgi:hypothetical protein
MVTIISGILTALVTGTLLLTVGVTSAAIANAQPATLGGQMLSGASQLRDQIIGGGQHIVNGASKGGAAFLKGLGTITGIHDVEIRINAARQDLANGNTAAASTELNKADIALKNDSITISGLGQEVTAIAQNKSVALNDNTRSLLSTVGNDLSSISLQMEGVNMTSSGGNNSTATVSLTK